MRAIGTLAVIVVSLLGAIQTGCAAHNSAAAPTYRVFLGRGSAGFSAECGYEAFQNANGSNGGIIRIIEKGKLPPGDPFNQTDEPTDGAVLSGNLDGFGKRVIKDKSANRVYTVDVVYHADNGTALVKRMIVLGC